MNQIKSVEIVTRFLFDQGRHFNVEPRRIKTEAFLPQEIEGRFETSVFYIKDLAESEIWDNISSFIENKRNDERKSKARADIIVESILNIGLNVEPEIHKSGHPLHANIINWSKEDDTQLNQAKLLCNIATLIIRPKMESN
ncbi:MAG: hypothetical protein A2Y33_12030 [Spirochaetes bacterium GWF1_51_8]|nr:MAG: hypothetical protein A2Y33_12030 [Spirochaetes bacterium GWF1_51_8]